MMMKKSFQYLTQVATLSTTSVLSSPIGRIEGCLGWKITLRYALSRTQDDFPLLGSNLGYLWNWLRPWLKLMGGALVMLLLLLLFSPASLRLLAQSSVTPTEAMLVANQEYEAGQYAEAAAVYEAIIATGLRNSDLYYNLGNAYFKQGDLGRAILNYRRAQYLEPRDVDITANLNLARTQTVDRIDTSHEEGLANWVQISEEWLTLREAAILALILWLLLGIFAILILLRPQLRRWASIVMAVLALFLVIGLISMANRLYNQSNYPPAVIVAKEIDVTSGPGTVDQYLVEFTLHSGTEVSLIESRPGWQRITLPGDLQGWVPADAVEPIIKATE